MAIASGPYTERLTRAGKPIAWDDPAVSEDPDLRILAFFPTTTANRGKTLAVGYAGKISPTFELR